MEHERKSAIANIATGVGLFVLTSAFAVWALNIATEPKGLDSTGLPPCTTEDQVQPDCYWDRGSNGAGLSFIVVNGTVTYEDGTTKDVRDEMLPPCTDAIADAGGMCFGPIGED